MVAIDNYTVFQHYPLNWRENTGYLWYGDFETAECNTEADRSALYIMPDALCGSDYSGSLVERSNHDVFLDEYGDRDGVCPVVGGHGTFAVAISLAAYDNPENEDMRESLYALDDYPVLDEDHHTMLEQDAIDDAWNDYICGDFTTALERAFDIEIDADNESLRALFFNKAHSIGEYPINECGGSVYIDVDKIAGEVKLADLITAVGADAITEADDD